MIDRYSTDIAGAAFLAYECDAEGYDDSDDGHEYGGLVHPDACECEFCDDSDDGHEYGGLVHSDACECEFCDAPVSEFSRDVGNRDDSNLF